jgi:hypothetical protein
MDSKGMDQLFVVNNLNELKDLIPMLLLFNSDTIVYVEIIDPEFNPLIEEVQNAFLSAEGDLYSPAWVFTGTYDVEEGDSEGTTVTATYEAEDVVNNPMIALFDLARYLGALARQDGASITSIVYEDTVYTWNPDREPLLKGSNWEDEFGNTLISAIGASLSDDSEQFIYLTLNSERYSYDIDFVYVVNPFVHTVNVFVEGFEGSDSYETERFSTTSEDVLLSFVKITNDTNLSDYLDYVEIEFINTNTNETIAFTLFFGAMLLGIDDLEQYVDALNYLAIINVNFYPIKHSVVNLSGVELFTPMYNEFEDMLIDYMAPDPVRSIQDLLLDGYIFYVLIQSYSTLETVEAYSFDAFFRNSDSSLIFDPNPPIDNYVVFEDMLELIELSSIRLKITIVIDFVEYDLEFSYNGTHDSELNDQFSGNVEYNLEDRIANALDEIQDENYDSLEHFFLLDGKLELKVYFDNVLDFDGTYTSYASFLADLFAAFFNGDNITFKVNFVVIEPISLNVDTGNTGWYGGSFTSIEQVFGLDVADADNDNILLDHFASDGVPKFDYEQNGSSYFTTSQILIYKTNGALPSYSDEPYLISVYGDILSFVDNFVYENQTRLFIYFYNIYTFEFYNETALPSNMVYATTGAFASLGIKDVMENEVFDQGGGDYDLATYFNEGYSITMSVTGGASHTVNTLSNFNNVLGFNDYLGTGKTIQLVFKVIVYNLNIEISFRKIGTSSATRTSEYDFGTNLNVTADANQYIGDTIESIIYSYLGNSIDISSISYGIYYFDPLKSGSLETHSNNRYGVYTNIYYFKEDLNWNINLVRITISYNDPV